MNQRSERIRAAIIKAELSYGELSRLSGIPKSALQRYATGETEKIPIDRIEQIARYTDVPVSWLMWHTYDPVDYLTGEVREPASVYSGMNDEQSAKIPILGVVPAGIPIEAIQDIVDWEEIPVNWTRSGYTYFGLVVIGDSMYPKYIENDIVIIRKTSDCESGQTCLVYIDGYNATLKTVRKHSDGSLELIPYNREYPPKRYTKDEVRDLPIVIGGVAVEMRRKEA